MRNRSHARRCDQALTMVELLVCLGILAIALGSVLSVFVSGTRFAATAQRRMDAGRVARGVHERFARGWEEPAAGPDRWHGRDENGAVIDETVMSQEMYGISDVLPSHAPAYVVDSPVPLVWKCEINPYAGALPDMHLLTTVVSHDTNDNNAFDTTDELIGTYYALLADRSP